MRKKTPINSANTFSIYLAIIFLLLVLGGSVFTNIPFSLFFYYLLASILSIIVYAIDKSKSKNGKWRIQEKNLHLLALFGGWPGAAIAQQKLRHKTQKQPFRLVFWCTVIINTSGLIFILWMFTQKGHIFLNRLFDSV